ncbi:MAG: methionine adenosyltransferase domain-containing protein, partial [Campylobacterales bacterium]
IIYKIVPNDLISNNITYHINPTGRFVIGGPQGDCGLTGRKVIVDTYGGSCPHGGGAFSGKDPSKVDRSAAYMARYIAKNLVASGVLSRATVQLAYAIGVVEPISVMLDSHGTSKIAEEKIEKCIRDVFKLTPRGIIESLELIRPIYRKTASYGHFGRELPEFSWEKLDKVDEIKEYLGV